MRICGVREGRAFSPVWISAWSLGSRTVDSRSTGTSSSMRSREIDGVIARSGPHMACGVHMSTCEQFMI